MNRLCVLFVLLTVSFLTVEAQDTIQSRKIKGKYFKYSILTSSRSAIPLFAVSPSENPDMIDAEVEDGDRNWTAFTTDFINQVLKKYLTVEEIRKLIREDANRSNANACFYYDYYGNILYAAFIYKNDYEHILTDEKLYGIYQGLMKLKVDVTGFRWWVNKKTPTPEQQKKVFRVITIPFFFRSNCP